MRNRSSVVVIAGALWRGHFAVCAGARSRLLRRQGGEGGRGRGPADARRTRSPIARRHARLIGSLAWAAAAIPATSPRGSSRARKW